MKIFSFILFLSLLATTNCLITINAAGTDLQRPEGTTFAYTVEHQFSSSVTCSTTFQSAQSSGSNADYGLSGTLGGNAVSPTMYLISTDKTVTFTFTASLDGTTEGPETITLRTRCGAFSKDVTFTITEDTPGGNGDPHFSQYVKNELNNKTERICYDVTAERNQFINIFTQKQFFQTEFFGQLKDDYYMHKIVLKSQGQMVEGDVQQISFSNNELIVKWDEKIISSNWLEFRGIFYKKTEEMIELKRSENDKLTFLMIRRKDNYGKYYLDVGIGGLTLDYSGMDGLMGRIGNSKISIYEQIQESNINEGRTTIEINGFKTVGYEQIRNDAKCILIKVNDLLFPQNLQEFIFEKF